jgi:uncharacterized membrane protein YqjE
MMGVDHQPSGLFHSLRRLADTGLGAIQNRVELFAVEFREEESHALGILAWGLAALFCGMLSVVVLTGTVVLLFEPEVRVYVAGGFCLLYFVGALAALFGLKARLKNRPAPFAETINQMNKDREWLTK